MERVEPALRTRHTLWGAVILLALIGIAFWIGFVLHLVAAEAWIRWTRPLRRAAAVPTAAHLE